MQQGVQQALQSTALRLFGLGMSIDVVEQATGLSKKELTEIQIQLDKQHH